MMRHATFLAALAVAALAGPAARADTQPLLDLPPNPTYTPGTAFSFDVKVGPAGLSNLFSFQAALNFTATDPSKLAVSVALPSDLSRFPFGTDNSTFAFSQNVVGSHLALTFGTDPANQPVDAVPGANDILGVVTLTPGIGLTGPIVVSVDAANTSFTVAGSEGPIQVGFDAPADVTINPTTAETAAVPAPAAWLTMGLGAFGLMAAGRRTVRPIA